MQIEFRKYKSFNLYKKENIFKILLKEIKNQEKDNYKNKIKNFKNDCNKRKYNFNNY